jgi:hypothetical protein
MRWLLVEALALFGACASQQALIETDRRMSEIALRVAAVENTSQRLANAVWSRSCFVVHCFLMRLSASHNAEL